MQPLTETQMRQFVGNYLGQDKAETLLRQLKDRLRELGQTPLLLAMLCSIFRSGEALPNNLGGVFRQFTQFYEQQLKGDVPDPHEHRDDWSKLLQCLAFAMMQGPDPKQQPTELSIAIPRTKAEQVLTEFLQDREPYPVKTAERCLKDLLRHHLIQTNGDQIEFRHQLIQEYYAAEYLLRLLPELSDEELKRDYLNLLKWTEPIALMLALVDEEEQALRVVKLAIDDVDLMLGARLAGATSPSLQSKSVQMLGSLLLSTNVKIHLLETTGSKFAIREALQLLDKNGSHETHFTEVVKKLFGKLNPFDFVEDSDSRIRWLAISHMISFNRVNPNQKKMEAVLTKAVFDKDANVSFKAVDVLGEIGDEST